MRLVIRNGNDLDLVKRLASWLNRPTIDQISVSLPSLNNVQQQRTARTLMLYFNDCGCLWAASGKAAWDYIVATFDVRCLGVKSEPIG